MITILASIASEPSLAEGGSTWWQTIGGLLTVFGLLVLCLKMLAKWNRRHGGAEASVLTVWPLGPKREIQVLRLGEEVHYIYRHDNAMVLLKQDTLVNYAAQQKQAGPAEDRQGWKRFFPNGLPFQRATSSATGPAPDLTSV